MIVLKKMSWVTESPTVVALVSQFARMRLKPDEALHEYFIRAQELMTRLSDAGERISETIFMALVLNGFPERFENFVVQETFNPSANFTELRSRLTNFEESRKQRNGEEEQQNQLVAMPSRGKFETSSSKSKNFTYKNKEKAEESKRLSCYCCGKVGHIAKNCFLRNKAECRKCGKKGHLDVTCRSQITEKTAVQMPNSQSIHSVHLSSGSKVVSEDKVLID